MNHAFGKGQKLVKSSKILKNYNKVSQSSLASVSELDELSEKGSSEGTPSSKNPIEVQSEEAGQPVLENESKPAAALEYLDLMKQNSNPQKKSILSMSGSNEEQNECLMIRMTQKIVVAEDQHIN